MWISFYEPSVRDHFIHFRRVSALNTPFQATVIQCSEEYALIEAGDGFTGYILERDESYKNTDMTVFGIYEKFEYEKEILPISTENAALTEEMKSKSEKLEYEKGIPPIS